MVLYKQYYCGWYTIKPTENNNNNDIHACTYFPILALDCRHVRQTSSNDPPQCSLQALK